jgi:MFS family permease
VSATRPTATALLSTTQGMLPVFMLGGLSVQLGAELRFGAPALGVATTVFFAVSAAGSAAAGRLVQRRGTYPGMVAVAVLSAVSLIGIAGLATRWATVVAFLVIAGLGNAIAQPAANLLLSERIPPGRQGLFFGVKQAAVPLTTLLAGVSVPLVGLTVGWRWAFVLVAAGSLLLPVVAPRTSSAAPAGAPVAAARTTDPDVPVARSPLVVLAAGATLAAAAVNALAVFLVPSAVASGISESDAGYLLACGSALGIAARVTVGWRADRRVGGHLLRVCAMLALGAAGFVLLAVGAPLAVLGLATVLAFGAGWGWNGLFTFAVVCEYPTAVASATGITQTGLWLGGVIGPLVFGLVATATSYAVAWLLGAAALLGAGVVLLVARRLLTPPAHRRPA